MPRVALRTEQTAAAVPYAAAVVGPCLVPANIVPMTYAHLVALPEPAIPREVHLVERAPRDALTATMAETVMAAAELVPAHLAWIRECERDPGSGERTGTASTDADDLVAAERHPGTRRGADSRIFHETSGSAHPRPEPRGEGSST